jgi:hypothetical protein
MPQTTASQETALRHHVRLGGETVHPRFARLSLAHSVVLTVNSGYE